MAMTSSSCNTATSAGRLAAQAPVAPQRRGPKAPACRNLSSASVRGSSDALRRARGSSSSAAARVMGVRPITTVAGLNNGAAAQQAAQAEDLGAPLEVRSPRLGLPSKGRMAEDSIGLLKNSQLSVKKTNPRQYVARISQIPAVEVWFQRASDVVRKLASGDFDLGMVGYDMYAEVAGDDDNLVVVHDALGFGHCRLALGIPMYGWASDVNTLEDLKTCGRFTAERPLRVVTGYVNIAQRFFEEKEFPHFRLVTADGALEAAPAMGSADIILDLVSTGTTLKENNLKEIEGGGICNSEGILVANKRALKERPGLLPIVKELIERLEAHLEAEQFYSVTANMYGLSPEEIAQRLLNSDSNIGGLTGPTINNVYTRSEDGNAAELGFFAVVVCVRKSELYDSVKELRKLGGSGVLVQPMTYIFDAEPARWKSLVDSLDLKVGDMEELNISVDMDAPSA